MKKGILEYAIEYQQIREEIEKTQEERDAAEDRSVFNEKTNIMNRLIAKRDKIRHKRTKIILTDSDGSIEMTAFVSPASEYRPSDKIERLGYVRVKLGHSLILRVENIVKIMEVYMKEIDPHVWKIDGRYVCYY